MARPSTLRPSPSDHPIVDPASDGATALLANLIEPADILINGERPWDMRIHDASVAARLFARGNLGLGESYMDGAWDCDQLDELFHRVLRARLDRHIQPMSLLLYGIYTRLFNRQTRRRAWQVGEQHYDLGNDFYQAMLDSRLTYTCGYWANATTLDDAQTAKLDLICRKLNLRPGQRVLDIGCGWGSFMRHAAEHYGVSCVGVTISREQAELGQTLCAGLPVAFRLQDYRTVDEPFDHIVSLGMFEHVGRRNYRHYFSIAARCLRPDGLFLLHTIGKLQSQSGPDPWLNTYIFPNSELPTLGDINDACEDLFVVEDVHNFGADYDRTLLAWHANVERHWPRFADRYGERFRRMWRYYLLSCAGAFRARDMQLWQLVLSPRGIPGGYRRPPA